MTKLRTPYSTYRLQLHKNFTFDDAASVTDYLRDLGISHVYCSPYLQAELGSLHGYDVVDHQALNVELGGRAAHGRFCRTLGDMGMGQILDVVPNHMSLASENRYWWDVLENGASSRYASFFDIDWQPQEERLRDKVLVPILGDQYGHVLQNGGIKVVRVGSHFHVEAAGQMLPVSPLSLPVILARAAEYARSDTLSFLAASFGRLPVPGYADRRSILGRHRDKVVLYTLLERLYTEEPGIVEAIGRSLADLSRNLDALDDFLNQQNYRLSYWKTADQQLGYRRFFDVNTLIGVRVEREHVFEETHALVLDWLRRGVLDGMRIDHPDGLRDPLEYMQRLRKEVPSAWLIGEKILEPGEFLREEWPIQGTTGYDFMNAAMNVLVSPEGLNDLTAIYREFTGQPTDFHAIAHEKKISVEQEGLGSDVNRLTSIFIEICETNRNQRDYTRAEVRRAIREIAACFPVYRTYVVPERDEISEEDRSYIARAAECAKQRRTDIDGGLFDFLRDVLTMEVKGRQESEFVLRFQQFTGPVMAKGVEDTAFYCYNRLTGMNEVGSDPSSNGMSVAEFHAYCTRMQASHPLSMTALSTHDTKRSDDVRARLAVLSEMPGAFASALRRWTRMNSSFRTVMDSGAAAPDANTEYLFYQTLIGAWPLTLERAKAYMLKAVREAKQQTTWVVNNRQFEDALCLYIERVLGNAAFLLKLEQFVEKIKTAGRINSLAQTLLKYTVPGVPDLYQGGELWDLSLVDPDNRRPVDYGRRRELLHELLSMKEDEAAVRVMARADDGLPKMWTIHRALTLRREQPKWFGEKAAYAPLQVEGAKANHVIAYVRGDSVCTIVPRFTTKVNGAWQDTSVVVPEGEWCNRLTGATLHGGRIAVKLLLKDFPVALLVREDSVHA